MLEPVPEDLGDEILPLDSSTQSVGPLPLPSSRIPSEAGDEALPETLGGYRILGRLGLGGMGEVLLAYDEVLRREIAIKRIRRHRVEDEAMRRRFEVEARVTAVLQHPAIVPVYALVRDQDSVIYTMRPIDGRSLDALLKNIRIGLPGFRDEWPVARLVRLFLQASNAVAFAHSRGVIHRDLKPSNIMIGPFEEVLVVDWGLAKVLDGAGFSNPSASPCPEALAGLTPQGGLSYLVGTPQYMAAEQLRGGPPDRAFDVFALAVTLYEILALKLPCESHEPGEIVRARASLPPDPMRLQPARDIPPELSRVVLKALDPDPLQRFSSVEDLSRAVAAALEGRASWHAEPEATALSRWVAWEGTVRSQGDVYILGARWPGRPLKCFPEVRYPGNVRLELDLKWRRGANQLSVWFRDGAYLRSESDTGYRFVLEPGERWSISLLRSGRVVAGAKGPEHSSDRWLQVHVAREADQLSIAAGGEVLFTYRDSIPLAHEYLGLAVKGQGLEVRDVAISSRGSSAMVSCLAVPDAFFHRKLYDDARSEYDRVAKSQPGRAEGRLSAFRAGLCAMEQARLQVDEELKVVALLEAEDAFLRHAGENDSCLLALGRAMVAYERGDGVSSSEALALAFERYAGDPHLPAVREWLLGQLHVARGQGRRLIAELLPLAISHCLEGWGRRVIRDLADEVHRDWEVPSFLVGRGRFREGDRASQAEKKLFLGFWAGRPEVVEAATLELSRSGLLQPHHVEDAAFCLLELDAPGRARSLIESLQMSTAPGVAARSTRAIAVAKAATWAALGALAEAERALAGVTPDPLDRGFNGARLWLARGHARASGTARAIAALHPIRAGDCFASEHRAWFLLEDGDGAAAERELQPLVDRGDHAMGRNLCNFLLGLCRLHAGEPARARSVFDLLKPEPWPRTWTLGSHLALDRLGGGDLKSYLRGAFPWERRQLEAHRRLLDAARSRAPVDWGDRLERRENA